MTTDLITPPYRGAQATVLDELERALDLIIPSLQDKRQVAMSLVNILKNRKVMITTEMEIGNG